MNIPPQILKNTQYFSPQCSNFYQNLVKKLDKLFNKNKGQSQQSKRIVHSYNKKDIFKWFFSLNISQKITVCSFQNKWLSQILFQMFTLCSGEPRVKYMITSNFIDKSAFNDIEVSKQLEYETFSGLSQKSEYYTTYFTPINQDEDDGYCGNCDYFNREYIQRTDSIQKENIFLKNVRFITITDLNDTLTLSIDILNDENTFIELFNSFSNDQCFTSPINVLIDKNYNYSIPKWAKEKEKFSLTQLLAMFFEQTISLNYQYYQLEQDIIPYPYEKKVNELLEMNSKIEKYLLEESAGNKISFFDSIDFNSISSEIRNNKKIIEIISNFNKKSVFVYQNYFCQDQSFVHNYMDSNLIDESVHNLRNVFFSSIPKFVDTLTFIDNKLFFKVENFVYKMVFEKLCDMYSKKTYNELMMEMTNVDTWHNGNKDKKKKKKKKKKSKKNKKNEDNTIEDKKDDSIIEEIDLVPIVSKEENKIEMDQHILTNNFILKESNDNKTIINENTTEKKNTMLTIEKNKTNEIQHNHQEEQTKKKKDKFFLFPITHTTKHKKDQPKDPLSLPIEAKEQEKPKIEKKLSELKLSESISKDTLKESNFSINLSPLKESSEVASSSQTINLNNPIINNYYIIDNKNQVANYPLSFPKNVLPSNYQFNLPYFYINPYNQLSLYAMNDKSLFFSSLTKEMENYASTVTDNLSMLSVHKEKYIDIISTLIKDTLSSLYEIELIYYGSYATGLSIESSDIDILIKFKTIHSSSNSFYPLFHSNYKIEKIINLLEKAFTSNKEKNNFVSVKPIYTASVPVLKIQCDISKEISPDVKVKLMKSYKYDYSKDIEKIKFDLTFFDINEQHNSPSIPSQLVVEYIKNSLVCFPEIKPVIFVLKRYMQNLKLNSSFSGGISSFSLFLLLLAYLKLTKLYHNTSHSLSRILIEFLECYSNLNFKIYCIDVNAPNPFILLSDLHDNGMMILDPFTSLNVAKSSFKVDEIKSAFMKALNIINKGLYCNNVESSNILNELFNL